MPVERKHIEAIEKILDREINYIDPASELSLRAVINAALAACDESPCVWESDGNFYRPSCDATKGSAFMPGDYCCYCGRKIADAPLPAAPEIEAARTGDDKEAGE